MICNVEKEKLSCFLDFLLEHLAAIDDLLAFKDINLAVKKANECLVKVRAYKDENIMVYDET